jgi:hypothetical protein
MGFPIPHPQEGESKKLYWNMWYGPDIIRGPSENGHDFYVVEDVQQHVRRAVLGLLAIPKV